MHAQALVFEQHLDVGEPVNALAQHLVDGGLVEELLRRMSGGAAGQADSMNATPAASTNATGRLGSMSTCSRSASPTDCQMRMTSSSVEIARARP